MDSGAAVGSEVQHVEREPWDVQLWPWAGRTALVCACACACNMWIVLLHVLGALLLCWVLGAWCFCDMWIVLHASAWCFVPGAFELCLFVTWTVHVPCDRHMRWGEVLQQQALDTRSWMQWLCDYKFVWVRHAVNKSWKPGHVDGHMKHDGMRSHTNTHNWWLLKATG